MKRFWAETKLHKIDPCSCDPEPSMASVNFCGCGGYVGPPNAGFMLFDHAVSGKLAHALRASTSDVDGGGITGSVEIEIEKMLWRGSRCGLAAKW
jgi:hypothetical protein